MAKQNLFERYGIKEVADVTFYRIERKDETYESQREISISSVLKSAIETRMVYPLENGVGAEEGFEAYVFTNASILTGHNYECDDGIETVTYTWEDGPVSTPEASEVRTNATKIEGSMDNKDYSDYNSKTGGTPGEVTKTGDDYEVTYTYQVNSEDSDVGTHEYSYEEQLLMLFAKNQNLIDKRGVRYKFGTTNLFGNLEFIDEFAIAPNSTEKIVVVGFANAMTQDTYDVKEVNDAINQLEYSFKAKAYDIKYSNYIELLVEDEMGYFNPNKLSSNIDEKRENISGEYTGEDNVIANAVQWKDNESCASINDAIEALRKKKLGIDFGDKSALTGLTGIKGGYNVTAITQPEDKAGIYTLNAGSASIQTSNTNYFSGYALAAVLDALTSLASNVDAVGHTVEVSDNGTPSNRAIYVKVDSVDTAASAYIYLLTNVNMKKLNKDEYGLFWFTDRNGKKAYYQDPIFAKKEYLALVVIGTNGLIFTVGRNGVRSIEKIGWMVNENGYITNSQAESVVKNGVIHTVEVTVNDESFDATCTVSGLKIRKIQKRVNRYVPVLFLDTLKVSTIEQTAETTYATGGRGNANLIGWDFNKEVKLTLQDALYTPASMSAMLGSYEGNDFTKGVKDTKKIDRMEKCIAKRSFIVPAGNSNGTPSEGENSAQAVYIEVATMQPYQDGAPIAEGEVYLKWTRSVAYDDNSLGATIEISADKFPGTYKIVGDTFARSEATGEDQRFQFVIPKAKISPESTTITLEAEGDPAVFDMSITVLRPEDGIMVKLIQYDVVENEEENDGSTMVKDTENLNLLDNAEMFKVNADSVEDETYIGATEY